MQQFVAITVVLSALLATIWLLRRNGAGMAGLRIGRAKRNDLIEPLDRVFLTPQHSIHVLRIEGKTIAIAAHPQGVTLLRECEQRDYDPIRKSGSP